MYLNVGIGAQHDDDNGMGHSHIELSPLLSIILDFGCISKQQQEQSL